VSRVQTKRALLELRSLAAGLEALGANVTLAAPGTAPLRIGTRPGTASVVFRTERALAEAGARDHLRLAEAYLAGEIDIEGDFLEVMKITELVAPELGLGERIRFALRWLLRNRRRLQRESIAFHYDRPPAFFLPWLDRWRSYSHGFYASPDDSVTDAQARKLQFAIDALALRPGDRVFDMGCGWGSFVEYAGLQGIRVHGITISREQHRFVEALVRDKALPCRVDLVDFLDFRPGHSFRGAVFMGTFEHFLDYAWAARFLARHLDPDARVYTDFCAQRDVRQVGAFLARYVWPGAAVYVDVPHLLRALQRSGFDALMLQNDTASYACTVRSWADAFEAEREALAARFGEREVRVFRLFLRASEYFLSHAKTQAYHLVAGRGPMDLWPAPGSPRIPPQREGASPATAAANRSGAAAIVGAQR